MTKTEYSCPTCKSINGDKNQIQAGMGQIQCMKNPEHCWKDLTEFLGLKPAMEFAVAAAKFPEQEGHTSITLKIPIKLKEALEAKFGRELAPTIAAQMNILMEGDTLVVPRSDLDRLSQWGVAVPKNGGELAGVIYALTEEVKEIKMVAEIAQKDLAAYQGFAPGRVVVNLGTQMQNAVAKAQDANLPLQIWVERSLINALESSWF